MEIIKNMELVEVAYENDGKKCIMTFFDPDQKKVKEVSFNKQVFNVDTKKFVDDDSKAELVEQWANDYFGVPFAEIGECLGVKKDIYAYDTFSALWESKQIKKFTADQKGQMFPTTIDEVVVDEYHIRIRYTIDGEQYESKQTMGKYLESMKMWAVDDLRVKKEHEKFLKRYGVPVERAEEIVGMDIFVEVKSCFGDNYYGDIKVAKKKGK